MTNAQEIYKYFREQHISDAGARALMGNLEAESGLISCRLQGDFEPGYARSKAYANRVDNGLVSVEDAASDGLGWGLAQWTYPSRKRGMMKYALMHGISVGNREIQLEYIREEMQTEFPGLWSYLCTTSNLYEAVSRVCKEYERPAVNNIQARYEFARGFGIYEWEQPTLPVAGEPEEPVEETFWPPRMLCEGMQGADVGVMQFLLLARNYTFSNVLSDFGGSTGKALRKFQREHGLDADGICGPLTWAALLQRDSTLSTR